MLAIIAQKDPYYERHVPNQLSAVLLNLLCNLRECIACRHVRRS